MSSIKCPQCGLVNWATADACKRCGLAFADDGTTEQVNDWQYDAQQYQSQNYQSYGYQSQGYQSQPFQSTPNAYYGFPEGPQSKGMAIASLVLGVLSMMTFGLLGVGALTGLVLGIVALRRAKRDPVAYGGDGLAIGGIVVNALSVFLFAYIALVAAIAVPNLLASRRAANEASAINSLRTLSSAQATYQSTAGVGYYGTLQQLEAASLIDSQLASGVKNGYRFEIRAKGTSYEAVATPLDRDGSTRSGDRSFYVSENGVIRGAKKSGLEATALDPPITDNDRMPRSRRAYSQPAYQEY